MFAVVFQYESINAAASLYPGHHGWLAFESLMREVSKNRRVSATYLDTGDSYASYHFDFTPRDGMKFRSYGV
jgi:hypothetical protein